MSLRVSPSSSRHQCRDGGSSLSRLVDRQSAVFPRPSWRRVSLAMTTTSRSTSSTVHAPHAPCYAVSVTLSTEFLREHLGQSTDANDVVAPPSSQMIGHWDSGSTEWENRFSRREPWENVAAYRVGMRGLLPLLFGRPAPSLERRWSRVAQPHTAARW